MYSHWVRVHQAPGLRHDRSLIGRLRAPSHPATGPASSERVEPANALCVDRGPDQRYPDTRDIGYPFSRPFAASISDTIRNLPAAAGRTVTIRHVAG